MVVSWCCLYSVQVISNVFFKGALSNTTHVIITLVIISAATVISLSYDCLGFVLELNVSCWFINISEAAVSLIQGCVELLCFCVSLRGFWVPYLSCSSSPPPVSWSSRTAAGFVVKTSSPASSWRQVFVWWLSAWSWWCSSLRTVHTEQRCSTAPSPTPPFPAPLHRTAGRSLLTPHRMSAFSDWH